jgi:hypothetical protein
MKYVNKFDKYIKESTSNIDFALSKIKEQFSEEDVAGKFDNEILEWVEDGWEDDYESEYDWYIDHNNEEAQDVVISKLISWYERAYKKQVSTDEHSELYDILKDYYNL